MKTVQILIALPLGVGMALLQLFAVGMLNEATPPPHSENTVSKVAQPLIVHEKPKTIAEPPRSTTSVRTATPDSARPSNRLRASALPALKPTYAGLGLGTALPSLGTLDLGRLDLPDAPPEPDRAARAKHTVSPVYPRSAQREGIDLAL